MSIITIANNGQEIVSTDYWMSEYARAGKLYLSINAGAFRLLVPAALESQIVAMETGVEVVVSRGPWPQRGKHDAMEFLFEDHTQTPYSIHLGSEQCDRMPISSDRHKEHVFAAWTSAGKQLELPAWYREVKFIPWLRPLNR